MARPTKAKAMERLRKVLNEIPELRRLSLDAPNFKRWRRNAEVAIANTFDGKSGHVAEFKKIRFPPIAFSRDSLDPEFQAAYVRGLESAESVLESMLEEIEEYWEGDKRSPEIADSGVEMLSGANKVFVIHGHDESARETVARFLERMRLEPVILHEQPNMGRTIIEKFEDYADVKFAVVLLTPDDVGALETCRADLRPRARQNVVFEFGYFIGKLGRGRVCALVKGDIERPSDSDGVLYVPLDENNGWKLRLLRELKAVGFELDANQALSA